MSKLINYYQILNISQEATFDEITEAYQTRTNEVESTVEKKLIEEAYDILSNPRKKSEYDSAFLAQAGSVSQPNSPKVVRRSSQVSSQIKMDSPKKTWQHKMFLPVAILIGLLTLILIIVLSETSNIIDDYNVLAESYEDTDLYREQIVQLQEELGKVMAENDDLMLKVQEFEQSASAESPEFVSLETEYSTLLEQYSELENQLIQLNTKNEELLTLNGDLVSKLELSQSTQVANQGLANSGGTFGLGSTKDEVKAIMGTPDSIIGGSYWYYGESHIEFDFTTELVDGWNNRGELKVK